MNCLGEGLEKERTAVKDQVLRTNSIKSKMDKQDVSPVCRMCSEREETVGHIVAESKTLVQKYFKGWRLNKVVQVIHWQLCDKLGFEREIK